MPKRAAGLGRFDIDWSSRATCCEVRSLASASALSVCTSLFRAWSVLPRETWACRVTISLMISPYSGDTTSPVPNAVLNSLCSTLFTLSGDRAVFTAPAARAVVAG